MRRTRFGALVLATGGACFVVALVAGSLAPALLGVLLVALSLAGPSPAAAVEVERRIPERVTVGVPFEVLTVAKATPDVVLVLEEESGPPLTTLGTAVVPRRGESVLTTRHVATAPGAYRWTSARVRFQDQWGFFEDSMVVPAPGLVSVLPETRPIHVGRRARARPQLGARARRRLALDRDPEFERLRDYVPGDRLRDIDWAHSTKLGKLIAREMRQNPLLPVVLLLQATPSMRAERRGSKLATSVHASLAVAAAAEVAGLATGLVAWTEDGLAVRMRATRSARALREALLRLGQLPPSRPTLVVPPPDPRGGAPVPPSPAERLFLSAASAFAPVAGGSTTPVEAALAALARVSPQPSLVVAFLDGEEAPLLVSTLLRRLQQRGHRVVVVCPASGSHHYTRREVDDATLDLLLRWRRNRAEVERECALRRSTFLSLGPHLTDDEMEGVIRSVR